MQRCRVHLQVNQHLVSRSAEAQFCTPFAGEWQQQFTAHTMPKACGFTSNDPLQKDLPFLSINSLLWLLDCFLMSLVLVVYIFNWKYLLENLTNVRAPLWETLCKHKVRESSCPQNLQSEISIVSSAKTIHSTHNLICWNKLQIVIFFKRGKKNWKALVEMSKVSPSDKGSYAPVMRRKGTCYQELMRSQRTGRGSERF